MNALEVLLRLPPVGSISCGAGVAALLPRRSQCLPRARGNSPSVRQPRERQRLNRARDSLDPTLPLSDLAGLLIYECAQVSTLHGVVSPRSLHDCRLLAKLSAHSKLASDDAEVANCAIPKRGNTSSERFGIFPFAVVKGPKMEMYNYSWS